MTPHRAALEQGLAGRYVLERELGAGGMATVYLAHDLKHDRRVALKVLRPELAQTLGPERFQREIRLAAGLQHPHILTVHDSGETAGQLWFTMPYVEGESLRDRLNREKQLPLEDSLRIAREAARALDHAHEHGVVHRDIKPENILLTADGSTLVADFGIARALGSRLGEQLTQTGTSIGTAAYMSPEQAAGERDVDGRSDIYSLAIVLYEMLAGETPFQAATPQATIARRFTETPKPLRAVRDSVPEEVEAAVQRALSRTAADRFGTAREFGEALSGWAAGRLGASRPRNRGRRAAIMLLLGVLIGAGALFAWRYVTAPAAAAPGGVTRLAVLPFENLGDSTDEYFSDGLTDEVRGKLAGLAGLQVTARASSSEYKHTTKSLQEIGRELGVEYLLTGTVRWDKSGGEQGSRVRVSPELIAVATGATDWQQPFNAALTDVFEVQADIAAQVARALDVALAAPQQQTLAARPTENLAAYDAYLQGTAARSRGAAIGGLREALGFFERAVALDSTFVDAWAGASEAASLLVAQGVPWPGLADRARAAADRALILAPDQPDGYRALGDYYRRVGHEPERALAPYRRGLELAPGDADVLRGLGLAEQANGEWDQAIAHLTQSEVIDPRSAITADALASAYLWLRRYPEAIRTADRALTLQPGSLNTIQTKVIALVGQGDMAAARALVASANRGADQARYVADMATYWDMYWLLDRSQQTLLRTLQPEQFNGDRASWGLALAGAYEMAGDMRMARVVADSARIALEKQLAAGPDTPSLAVLLGVALAYVGRHEEAVRVAERGLARQPVSKDAITGAYNQHQLARVYILTGEHEKALDLLEPLFAMPYYLSPTWLREDPTFAPLRGNPRFERLAELQSGRTTR